MLHLAEPARARVDRTLDISRAKLAPPPLSDDLIARPRLARRMRELAAARLSVVEAPAGYGKSCLLAGMCLTLAKNGEKVGWLTLDAGDRAPARFIAGLAAAAGLNLQIPQADTALELLLDSIAELDRPLLLFLDDAHLLNGSPAAAVLQALVDQAGPMLRLAIGARARLDLHIARLRGRGALLELGVADLAFDRDEIRRFLIQGELGDARDGVLERIAERTQGWPTAMRLLAGRIDQGEPLEALLKGGRREFVDFFEEEVLDGQPEDVRAWLRLAAIPDRICARLFSAMSGTNDGARHLDRLCAAGLFVRALDHEREWYGVHPLLAEHLRQVAKAEALEDYRGLCLSAAAWFETAGLFREAVDLALRAGEPTRAAELLDAHSEEFYAAGHEEAILPYAALLPAEIRARYPRLLIAMSWRLQVEWKLDRSRELLDSAKARVDEMAREGECPPGELRFFENQFLHRSVMQAQLEDDFAFIDKQAEKLLRDYSDASPYIRGSLYAAMLYAQREQYELGQQNRLEALSREQLEMADSRYVLVFLDALAAPGRMMRGQTERLIDKLTASVREAEALTGAGSALGAVVALPLAEVHFERGEVEPARRLLDLYLPNATGCGFVDQVISGWLTEARMLRQAGEIEAALLRLDDGMAFAAERSLHRVRIFAATEAIDLHCRLGNLDEAARLGSVLGLTKAASSAIPENRGTRAEAARALAWTKIAQLRGQYGDAIAVAKHWRAIVLAAGAVRERVRWDLRIAALQAVKGEERPAWRTLQQALVAAAPGRLLFRFVEEAKAIGPLLSQGMLGSSGEGDFQVRFARDVEAAVRAANGGGPAPAPSEPAPPPTAVDGLSAREVKILKLVASGLLNGEIGDQLGITEGSVKWYLQQIYDKVGARRRLLAVEHARRLGLLD
ncbi:MAG: LuxR C-terminal-related transcriptional regulator [Caulobacteraceae bacterium]